MEGSQATRAKAKKASRKGEVPRYRYQGGFWWQYDDAALVCSLLHCISCNVLLDAFRRLGPNAMRQWSYDAQRQSRLC